MKTKMKRVLVICMFAGFIAGLIPQAANAQQEANQSPILLVKIRNINQLLDDVQKLMPPAPGSKTGQQIAGLRGLLQGTDWIDSERSIVAGMLLEGQKAKWDVLIPYRTANPNFQKAFNAIESDGCYMAAFPTQQGVSVSPAVRDSLIKASKTLAAGNLTLEASPSRLLPMLQPQMAAALKKMETAPPPKTDQITLKPQQIESMLNSMVEALSQVDILRVGLGLSGDVFTVHFDLDALPNTKLAGLLVDRDGDMRLMNCRFDMPIEFRSRGHNMSGLTDLMKSVYGPIFSQLGINVDDMVGLISVFTGEMAGGISIDKDGLVIEEIAVLKPGINGEEFLQNTYMPWFERYNKQVSEMAAKQSKKPGVLLYERTADSMVDGIKVVGVNTNLDAVLPPDAQKNNPFAGKVLEMRMAAAGNLLFMASSDRRIGDLITMSHSLVAVPAQGPTFSFDLDLGAFFKEIKSMLPPGKASNPLPSDLGKITVQGDIGNGKLATQTSFNIAELQKLVSAIGSAAARKAGTKTNSPAANPSVN